MKVIFLDIDGVLNNHDTLGLDRYIPTPLVLDKRIHDHMSPWCIWHLNDIIKQSDAKVVISSTWRLGESTERLQAMLDVYGFKGEVIGKTDWLKTNDTHRGDEIRKWLEEHWNLDIESFVILDDDSDMGKSIGRLIKTKNEYGLRGYHVKPTLKVLNNNYLYIIINYVKLKLGRLHGTIQWKLFKKWRF